MPRARPRCGPPGGCRCPRGGIHLGKRHFVCAAARIPVAPLPIVCQTYVIRQEGGLSAIGAELHKGRWTASIHPLAHESVRRRRVSFLKPLVNWKYALNSLERARRYAVELGYTLSSEEEKTVWDVLEAQDDEGRQAILTRYRASGRGGDGKRGTFGVAEELACRRL